MDSLARPTAQADDPAAASRRQARGLHRAFASSLVLLVAAVVAPLAVAGSSKPHPVFSEKTLKAYDALGVEHKAAMRELENSDTSYTPADLSDLSSADRLRYAQLSRNGRLRLLTPELKQRFEDIYVRYVQLHDAAVNELRGYVVGKNTEIPECAAAVSKLMAERPNFEQVIAQFAAMPMGTLGERLAATMFVAMPGTNSLVGQATIRPHGTAGIVCGFEKLGQALQKAKLAPADTSASEREVPSP